jgi:hypothetical protein
VQPITGEPGAEPDQANPARVYDLLLGGSHHFTSDRAFAAKVRAAWPEAAHTMQANRAFLGRAVRYLAAEAGIRQFLDIGSGLPTMANVHEVAQQVTPDARVVYVDNDPVAVQHSRAVLAGASTAVAIQADLRRPHEILAHPGLRDLLDLTRPVGLLLVAVLHFITDEQDPATPGHLAARSAPGWQPPRPLTCDQRQPGRGSRERRRDLRGGHALIPAPQSRRDPRILRRL